MKRSLSIALALMMVFSLVLPIFAASGGSYLVRFYALDGTTFVCSQEVPAGGFIDGGDWDLYNSWSAEGGMMEINYKVPAGWKVIPYMLKDLDTGEVFNWTNTPITKVTNVTLAVY